MSSLTANTTALRTLTGGLLNAHQDTFPSILFLLLFGATCLLSLYRLAGRYRRPTRLLLAFLRIHVFEAVRVATFIMRLVGIANHRAVSRGDEAFDTTLLIVEQVLLSVGYAMPASTLVQLAGFHAGRGGEGGAKQVFTLSMELALMGAIVLGVIAGTKVGKAQTDASAADTVKTAWTIAAVIVLVVLGLLVLFCVHVSRAKGAPRATSTWIAGTSLLLMLVPIFRLATTAHPPADSNSTGAKAVFYIFQWLVGAFLLVVDAKAWCGIEDARGVSSYQESAEAHWRMCLGVTDGTGDLSVDMILKTDTCGIAFIAAKRRETLLRNILWKIMIRSKAPRGGRTPEYASKG